MTSHNRQVDTMGYSVSVDEMILQDHRALNTLKDRMRDQLDDNISDSDYVLADPEDDPESWTSGKPMRAYDEDGTFIGMHLMLTVEVPVVRP